MFPVSSCSCLSPIQWSQVLSREWWCSWSSADRRCSNYIWVIDSFIAYWGVPYIRDLTVIYHVNTLRVGQNGHHFTDKIFKCIFLNENVRISIKISLKFVPKGPIGNIPALVQIKAWRRSGDKPLSEPKMVKLPTHIWVDPCVLFLLNVILSSNAVHYICFILVKLVQNNEYLICTVDTDGLVL